MRLLLFAAIAAGLALSACAGRMIDDKMKGYLGQPASALITKLGYPTRQDEIAGKKIYVWAVTGMYRGTSHDCTIRAILNPDDTISSYDFGGNEAACESYAMLLNR
jgi:hypothetical protein